MIEVSGNREDMVMTELSEEFVQQTEPFRRELLAHCYRVVGSVDEAEDLVQEPPFPRAHVAQRAAEPPFSLCCCWWCSAGIL